VADGRRAQAVLDDVDQLLALRRRQEALGGVELDALGRETPERHAPDVQRPLGDLGGEAFLDQRVEDLGS
jgi:hypothetical protein